MVHCHVSFKTRGHRQAVPLTLLHGDGKQQVSKNSTNLTSLRTVGRQTISNRHCCCLSCYKMHGVRTGSWKLTHREKELNLGAPADCFNFPSQFLLVFVSHDLMMLCLLAHSIRQLQSSLLDAVNSQFDVLLPICCFSLVIFSFTLACYMPNKLTYLKSKVWLVEIILYTFRTGSG